MKKISILIISALIISSWMTITGYAADCKSNDECKVAGEICVEGLCQNSNDFLLPRPGSDPGLDIDSPELKAVEHLPNASSEDIFKTAIKTMLGASMLLTIIAMVIAGIYYIQSQGQEEDITKAKNILLYLIIGMVIMAAAYGLVGGIIQFKFFKAAP